LNTIAIEIAHNYEYLGFIFIGDDHFPITEGWNFKMYESLVNNGKFSMVYGNDLRSKDSLCAHVIMDARYVIQLGYFAHPSLSHLYCDDVWIKERTIYIIYLM